MAKDARSDRIVDAAQAMRDAEAAWRNWAEQQLTIPARAAYAEGNSAMQIDLGFFEGAGQPSIDKRVSEYIRDRIDSLVSVDGDLSVVATTKEALSDLVETAVAEEWTPLELSRAIETSVSFSADRAELIAETELDAASYAGALGAMQDAGVERKAWFVSDAHDQDDECDDNADDGDIDVDEAFSSGDFAPPAHPNCLPGDAVVSAAGVSAHFKRWFEGEIVRIRVASGHELTVTPNHPILTLRGWVPAGECEKGDYLVECREPSTVVSLLNPDDHHVQVSIKQVARALLMAGGVPSRPVPLASEDFHGDAIADQEVHVVRAAGGLESVREATTGERLGHRLFGRAHSQSAGLAGPGAQFQLIDRRPSSSHGAVRRIGVRPSLLRSQPLIPELGRLGKGTKRNAESTQGAIYGERNGVELLSEADGRLAGLVEPTKCLSVTRQEYRSHVYNLQTQHGFYLANSLLVHNCNCTLLAVEPGTVEAE